MYKAIEEIQKEFQKRDFKHRVEQVGENWVLRAGVTGDAASYDFIFIMDDDKGNDVAVRVVDIVKFPENRRDKGYEVLNRIQQQYRFIRLVMNDKGEVQAEYDFPVAYSNIGEGAFEILVRFTNILDKVYADMMRSIWA